MADTQADAPATPNAPATTPPAPDAAPAVAAPPPAKVTAKDAFAALKARAKEAAAKPAEAAPAEKPLDEQAAKPEPEKVDPDLAAVNRILQEDRRVKAEARRIAEEKATLKAERERHAPDLEKVTAVRAAMEKRDALTALRALGFTDAEIYDGDDSIVFKLAEARTRKPEIDAAAVAERVINEKLTAKDAAEKAAREAADKEKAEAAARAQAERAQVIEQAKDGFTRQVAEIAAADPSKYPTLVALGVPAHVATDYAWHALMESNGARDVSEQEALEAIEKYYAERVERTRPKATEAPAPAPVEAGPPIRLKPSPNPNWQAQTGTPQRHGGNSVKEKFEALKERARTASK